jgi:Skp family chaperone for outer membrane proteins
MRKISLFATSLFITALFAVSAFGQVATPAAGATKIGWINTAAFGDEKAGVNKYNNALKALEAEMKPRVTELQTMQGKLKTISDELQKMSNPPANVPVDTRAAQSKQEEGQRIQREFEFKKKEYDAAMSKRGSELLAPIQNDLLRAIQDYAKQKGYAVVLDIAALANDNMNAILALDPGSDITKDFIVFYNARPATTATTATPR